MLLSLYLFHLLILENEKLFFFALQKALRFENVELLLHLAKYINI